MLVLAGGVGAARFLRGLVQVVEPDDLLVVVNTGDDLRWHGLYVAPDLDTVMYWLAGLADEERGWGIRGDTFTAQGAFARLGLETWFQLGDQDLATHVYRTERLAAGVSLDRVTDELAARLHVRARLLPMSNEPVTTRLRTDRGDSHFQEYFVRDRCQPAVVEIYWTGLEEARPAPGIAEAIAGARAIVIAPSNPIISIGPILRVPGMREQGPTVELMRAQGLEASALGVAELYRDLASAFILDAADAGLGPAISGLGYRVATLPTLLDDRQAAQTVAATALNLVQTEIAA